MGPCSLSIRMLILSLCVASGECIWSKGFVVVGLVGLYQTQLTRSIGANEALAWSNFASIQCTAPPKSLEFCSMVDYAVLAQKDEPSGSIIQLDQQAAYHYGKFESVLATYDCTRPYSTKQNCSSCSEAYKYWLCSLFFIKCSVSDAEEPSCVQQGECDVLSNPLPNYQRPCLSLCQDISRKCPSIVSFICPVNNQTYSSTKSSCNKLDRADDWPGSFIPLQNDGLHTRQSSLRLFILVSYYVMMIF